jgi:hypothetical protein
MIKNDFIVWGMRKTVGDKQVPIRYHLAIDTKPAPGNTYQVFLRDDPESINLADLQPIQKAQIPKEFTSIKDMPQEGRTKVLYSVDDKIFNFKATYYWDEFNERELTKEEKQLIENDIVLFPHFVKTFTEAVYVEGEPGEEITPLELLDSEEQERLFLNEQLKLRKEAVDAEGNVITKTSSIEYTHYFPIEMLNITTTDWRSELFLSGANTLKYGNNSNYYYVELENEWTKLYDLENQKWKPTALEDITSLDYFLDFIDSTAAISKFSISNIGRRSKIVVNDKINCIFEPEIPDFILIESGTEDTKMLIEESVNRGQNFLLIESEIYEGITQGGTYNSAFNEIQNLLYQYTGYNEAVTIQILPMYFLEPNTRITVKDMETGIYGDYMLNSFSVPLDINGTMSLSCTRALEKI